MRGRCSLISSPRGIEYGRRCDSGQNSPSTLHHREQEHCRKVHQAPFRASAATRTAAPHRSGATCAGDPRGTPPSSRCSATIGHQHSTFDVLLWMTARAFYDVRRVLLIASATAPGLGAMVRRVPRPRSVVTCVENEPIRVRADLGVPQNCLRKEGRARVRAYNKVVRVPGSPFHHLTTTAYDEAARTAARSSR